MREPRECFWKERVIWSGRVREPREIKKTEREKKGEAGQTMR